jgi:hypothetical protein
VKEDKVKGRKTWEPPLHPPRQDEDRQPRREKSIAKKHEDTLCAQTKENNKLREKVTEQARQISELHTRECMLLFYLCTKFKSCAHQSWVRFRTGCPRWTKTRHLTPVPVYILRRGLKIGYCIGKHFYLSKFTIEILLEIHCTYIRCNCWRLNVGGRGNFQSERRIGA